MSSDAWPPDDAPGAGRPGEAPPGTGSPAGQPASTPGAGTESGDGTPAPNPYGMGPAGSSDPIGPGFAPPPAPARPAANPGPYGHATHPVPPTPRPGRSKLPAIVTAAAVAVMVLILVVGTVRVTRVEQAPSSTASPTPTPSALPSSSENSIAFTSTEGSGRLTLVSSRWTSAGSVEPTTGQYLLVTIRISASEGQISYGPQYFQVFDTRGELFRTTQAGVRGQPLGDGRLDASESVTGVIAFDMPRDTVTLLMSNAMMETVTALRIEE